MIAVTSRRKLAAVAAVAVTGAATWWWMRPGLAAIGGPFTLEDGNGKVVRDSDFRGHFMLLTFGYTSCPDVCPAALGKVSSVLDRLDKQQLARLAVLFISVDPKRDNGQRLLDYGSAFHPSIIALTGTREQIDAAAAAYGAKYRFVGDTNGDNYTVDHTSLIYVMTPEGKLVSQFNHAVTAEVMAEKLQALLQ